MQVIDILNNMALLSAGLDTLTPLTTDIFLKYVNLANLEIFSETANLNSDLLINDQIQTTAGLQDVTLTNNAFFVQTVFVDTNFPALSLISFLEFLNVQQRFINQAAQRDPYCFTFRKNILSIYPIFPATQYNLSIWYAPYPSVITLDTAEADIPIPIPFHSVLVDAALYYLFLDEEGFKNTQKSMEAKARKEKTRLSLISYLDNQNIHTFMNA